MMGHIRRLPMDVLTVAATGVGAALGTLVGLVVRRKLYGTWR